MLTVNNNNNNNKLPYELNCEEFICTRYLNRYDKKSIEIVIGLGALWE